MLFSFLNEQDFGSSFEGAEATISVPACFGIISFLQESQQQIHQPLEAVAQQQILGNGGIAPIIL